ncbi:MAG: hypothetical protein GX022_06905 [Clostridiaceae bacterium]|nr:hypothetical protein [Clostridiaceae bacterium]
MKKTRFLVLVLVVSIMLIGAGYAYWNETLTINNTVSTGKLDVKFAGDPIVVLSDEGRYQNDLNAVSDVVKAKLRDDNDGIIDIEIVNFFPGAKATITFTVQNSGTIPVILESVNPIYDDKNEFLSSGLEFYTDENIYNLMRLDALSSGLKSTSWCTQSINAGSSREYTIHMQMPGTISGDIFEGESGSFSIQLNYTQYD